ncbi:MAG: hypothetical protein IKH76_06290 [Clostridiales bacterium]|nr:hypothetical protein [Clostridiales bacterium]
MVVVVVANPEFQLPKDSGARVMLKPFYCFPVAAILNAGLGRRSLTQGHMLLEGMMACPTVPSNSRYASSDPSVHRIAPPAEAGVMFVVASLPYVTG